MLYALPVSGLQANVYYKANGHTTAFATERGMVMFNYFKYLHRSLQKMDSYERRKRTLAN